MFHKCVKEQPHKCGTKQSIPRAFNVSLSLAPQKVAIPMRERGAGRDSTGDDEVLSPTAAAAAFHVRFDYGV